MKFYSAAALILATLAPAARAQDSQEVIVLNQEHNYTSLVGTWSSGSQNVVTGSGFVNPAAVTFTYPKTSGVSYSFTGDGYYEIARYRFVSNGSEPTCIVGVIGWVHGTYELLQNGSMVCTPFGDGFQQIQSPCSAKSNFFENYNETELYQSWRIYHDATTGGNKLHMFNFDGSPVAPQFQVSTEPNMLPTQRLRNVTGSVTTSKTKSNLKVNAVMTNAAPVAAPWTGAATVVGALVSGALALMAL